MRRCLHTALRKWFVFSILVVLFAIPFPASAQGEITLESVNVQLWPEFDQPSMLVIYDVLASQATSLPQELKVRVPADAEVIAVAYEQDGGLFNVPYQEVDVDANWKQVLLTLETATTYHLEYYAPLAYDGSQRTFDYLWPGDYAVASLAVSVRVPVDTTEVTTDPPMQETIPGEDGQTYLQWGSGNLEAGQEVPITVTYLKTSDRLGASNQPLETGAVDENTPGRVSLNNYYPYILGGLGVLLIAGGVIYFWQSSKGKSVQHKRHRSREEGDGDEQVHCHQCGKRAQPGDRFCRACGTRLRREQ
ncbi:MAG: zinc ribbon domain-containing protein [Chloroflexota bacterium]